MLWAGYGRVMGGLWGLYPRFDVLDWSHLGYLETTSYSGHVPILQHWSLLAIRSYSALFSKRASYSFSPCPNLFLSLSQGRRIIQSSLEISHVKLNSMAGYLSCKPTILSNDCCLGLDA